jgi:hypothetical protein
MIIGRFGVRGKGVSISRRGPTRKREPVLQYGQGRRGGVGGIGTGQRESGETDGAAAVLSSCGINDAMWRRRSCAPGADPHAGGCYLSCDSGFPISGIAEMTDRRRAFTDSDDWKTVATSGSSRTATLRFFSVEANRFGRASP